MAQDTLSVLFTGDVLLDRGVRPFVERKGTAYLFEHVKDIFHQADAVVINLECPLTNVHSPVHKKYIFRADTACAYGLRDAGITHAAMANNHTNDQGRQGLSDTHRHLTEAGITPLGYGTTPEVRLRPVIIRRKNMEIALFNALLFPLENWQQAEEKPDICQSDISTLTKAVESFHSKNPHTPIVVILHWGTEFQKVPHINQRINAQMLVKAGANAIIGHHPHVVQTMEKIGDAPVFYSLGNFVFDQTHPDACHSQMAVLRFTAGKGLIEAHAIPVRIKQCRPHAEADLQNPAH